MIRSAPTTIAENKTSQAKNTESSLQSADNLLEQNTGLESGLAAGFPSVKKGFDLARVPARPGLQTGLCVQCCAKDGKPCSCPTCKAKAADENEWDDEEHRESISPQLARETSGEQVSAAPDETVAEAMGGGGGTPMAQASAETDAASQSRQLIVDDSSPQTAEGQLRKTEFLQQLRSEICSSIGPILATAGQTTEGCPYLNYWLNLYQEKSAAEIEATVKRYAPDSVNARSASQYISIVTQRAYRAAEVWARTGRITEVPEGVPTTVPGNEAAAPTASTTPQAAAPAQAVEPQPEPATVQAKERNGGAKNVDDPSAIKNELGEGQPLDSGVRSRMETAFGMNFSQVRTHSDSNSAALSNRVNARAFTVGQHIAFGSEEYKPGSLIGDALIAHELAHTVQQKDAATSIEKMEPGSSGYNALERDADHAAAGVISSLWGGAKDGLKSIGQRVMPQLRSGLRIQGCPNNSSQQQSQPQQAPAAAPTVSFVRSAACSAFDDTITPPAIMVKTGGTNVANADIAPAGSAANVTFESADTSKATVAPATGTTTPQAVTITGVAAGTTTINAKQTGTNTNLASLRVSVKNNVPKTLAIHMITDTVNTPNLVPTNAPAAATLQTFVNDNIWGKQANVTFTVSRTDHSVRYDLDRNQKMADPLEVSATWAEANAISTAAKTTGVDFNIYYVKDMEVPTAFTARARAETWISDARLDTTDAHEIGHLMGRGGESTDSRDIMFGARSATKCEVRKHDWDIVNP
jgi:hypothetical protein